MTRARALLTIETLRRLGLVVVVAGLLGVLAGEATAWYLEEVRGYLIRDASPWYLWLGASVITWVILARYLWRSSHPAVTASLGVMSVLVGSIVWYWLFMLRRFARGLAEPTFLEVAGDFVGTVFLAPGLGLYATAPVSVPMGIVAAFCLRWCMSRYLEGQPRPRVGHSG